MTEGVVATKAEAIVEAFQGCGGNVMVMETGTHSRWVAQLLQLMGHEVIVANARKLKLISENNQKSDRVDAAAIVGVGMYERGLAAPGVSAEPGNALRSAGGAVRGKRWWRQRTGLINHVRGTVKSFGCRIRKCGAEKLRGGGAGRDPGGVAASVSGVLETLEEIDEQIYRYDCQIEHLCRRNIRRREWLLQVNGVGPVTALTYVLTIEDTDRFERSRDVGAYLGLVPKRRQSGQRDPQLGISKAGDEILRKLLVNCAHHMLGPREQDSDLRRWGLELVRIAARRKAKGARKLAAAAVARKLAVLLHRLWVDERGIRAAAESANRTKQAA